MFSQVFWLHRNFLLNMWHLFTRSKESYLSGGVGGDKLNRLCKLYQRNKKPATTPKESWARLKPWYSCTLRGSAVWWNKAISKKGCGGVDGGRRLSFLFRQQWKLSFQSILELWTPCVGGWQWNTNQLLQ